MTDELPLLERAAELAAIRAALDSACSGSGRLAVVEGEAGIGKSRLLASAVAAAGERGLRTLRARGSELEREYPYGVALALLEPLVRAASGSVARLDGPAAAVAPLFGHTAAAAPGEETSAAPASGDPFAAVHGLYWLVLDAAEHGPLLLAIDDAQWADAASLRFLHYLAQRVGELPVAIVATVRTTDKPADEAVAQLASVADAVVLRPAPLSEPAVGEAVRHVLGEAATDRSRAYWDATRGNPFYLTEILRDRRVASGAGAADAVPVSVARFVESRIARLEASSGAVAEAVAVLGESADLRRVAALTGYPDGKVVRVVRDLVRAAILDPGVPLGFAHPIVRQAVYEAIPVVARARAHRDAALLLRNDGAPAGVVGAQLLEAERSGDPRVVESLLLAAAEASGRGEHAVAARLLERALDEPPADDQVADVLIRLGRAEAAMATPTAGGRLEGALARIDDARRRAELLLELGHVLISAADWMGAAGTFERGMRELGVAPGSTSEELDGLEAATRAVVEQLEAAFVSAAWVSTSRRPEAERAIARILDDPTLGSVHRSLAVWSAFQKGTVVSAPAQELAALTLGAFSQAPIEELITEGQIVEVGAGVLVATDELLAEIDILTRAIAAAEAAALFGKVGVYSYCRAWPMFYTGRLADAVADAQAALRVAELGWETFLPASRAVLAEALLERGELDAAAEAVNLEPAGWGHRIDYQLLVPMARGRIALARGAADEAITHFDEAEATPAAAHFRAIVPPGWRVWKTVALARTGRRDEARALGREVLDIAQASGARWTLGVAQRAVGLAEGGGAGLELLREAVHTLEDSPALLERARALVSFGRGLRQSAHLKDARDALTAGMDLAHRLGATTLVDQARDELSAAGSRPRRYARTGVEALTPSELRVARLAADGRTNREIAQALFVTPKAVEYHLANAYPKLGITSRSELSAVLASA